jgi:hypothetical protein
MPISTKRSGVPAYDKADPDEPIFCLRAQDVIAPVIVELYALHLTTLRAAVPKDKVTSARKVAAAMRAWQATHETKVPD